MRGQHDSKNIALSVRHGEHRARHHPVIQFSQLALDCLRGHGPNFCPLENIYADLRQVSRTDSKRVFKCIASLDHSSEPVVSDLIVVM